MQNLRPSNIEVIFQRPSCESPIVVASGFIEGIAPVVEQGCVTFGHPSVHPVRLPHAAAVGLLQWAGDIDQLLHSLSCLQCSDAVGWAAGRASGL